MLEYIFYAFLIILAVIGFIEVLKSSLMKILNLKHTAYTQQETLIIPLYEKNEGLEIFLRKLIFKMKWRGEINSQRIIFLDLGMDKESKKIYNIISKDYDFLYLLRPDELTTIFKN